MRIPRYDGKGDIDIRLVRRLLGHYVRYHRRKGAAHGWPGHPVDGAARSPAALVRRFRCLQRRTHRQRKWVNHITKT